MKRVRHHWHKSRPFFPKKTIPWTSARPSRDPYWDDPIWLSIGMVFYKKPKHNPHYVPLKPRMKFNQVSRNEKS